MLEVLSLHALVIATATALCLATAYAVLKAVHNRYFHALCHFPGPALASVTSLWYFRTVRYGIAENCQKPLHDKYGAFVRIAPDTIAISDPAAIATIYGPKRRNEPVFEKAVFCKHICLSELCYRTHAITDESFRSNIAGARHDSFSERDESKHAERRKIQAPLYTQGAVLKYEPCIDRIIERLRSRLNSIACTSEVTDMSIWLRKYAFDVLGEIFFGREGGFGMLEHGVDYNGWCKTIVATQDIGAASSYMPYGLRTIWILAELVFGGPAARQGINGIGKLVTDATETVEDRSQVRKRDHDAVSREDMLSRLIEAVENRGDEVGWNMHDVSVEAYSAIWAGADTTAIALTSIFYHVHKSPEVLRRLRSEIDHAFSTGAMGMPVRFKDANQLPYLVAVIKEGMRVHHSLGTGLPRLVPKGGADVAGQWLPGGTTVIMNPNALNLDTTIFGNDADIFRPERWLDEDRVAVMSRHDLSFGYGPRICAGRHITMTEIYKVMPAVLRWYEFDFETPNTEWKVWHGWFQHQRNVNVRVKLRQIDG
ncbi:hypothetical protein LTR54_007614 [Friedmanniomyces endolithicus]|nr:hypothetical protein LTR54_007614 [Friedmanniomyces endolithicus]